MSDPSYLGQSPVFGDFPSQVIPATGVANYTMNFKVSGTNGLLVFINGSVQRPGIDFSAGGNQLLFTEVVPNGAQIFVYGMGLSKSSLAPSMGSVGDAEVAAGLKATPSDVTALTATNKFVTPASLAGLPLSQGYVSGEQTIAAAQQRIITPPPTFTTSAKLSSLQLICKTAEFGYAVGDRVVLDFGNYDSGGGTGASVILKDDGSVTIRYSDDTQVFIVVNATTGVETNITPANWRLIVYVWG